MKLFRRLLAGALEVLAEEIEPEPQVVPWPAGLGFLTTALGLFALGALGHRTDRLRAQLDKLGDVDGTLRQHRSDIDRLAKELAKDAEQLAVVRQQVEANADDVRNRFLQVVNLLDKPAPTPAPARQTDVLPPALNQFRVSLDGVVVQIHARTPEGLFVPVVVAGILSCASPRSAAQIEADFPVVLAGPVAQKRDAIVRRAPAANQFRVSLDGVVVKLEERDSSFWVRGVAGVVPPPGEVTRAASDIEAEFPIVLAGRVLSGEP